MKRLIPILLLLVFAAPAFAQADPKPAPPKADKQDPGIPADFNAYLKKIYPNLDPGGEHDLFNLKDYKDKDKRHDYTVAMVQMLLEYMTVLDMGPTISKQFDQYSRGKEGNQPTFKVLYAVVLMYYPPGQPNVTEALKLLHEAAEMAPGYAYPWFLLAQFEYARFRQIKDTSPGPVLRAVDKALTIRPDFLRAILLKGKVYMMAKPPRTADVRELIDPYVNAKLSKIPDDFEDALGLYGQCHKPEELYNLIKTLIDSGKLTAEQKVRAMQAQIRLRMGKSQFDDAIGDLDTLSKWVNPAKNPDDAMFVHRRLAECWGTKAMDIKKTDPELKDPKHEKDFNTFADAAQEQHRICTEIERENLPLALHGLEALDYAVFVGNGRGRLEEALEWLTGYLDKTDLTTAQRNRLENLRALFEIQLHPTEANRIKMLQQYVEQDDMEKLGASLALAQQNIQLKGGPHFEEADSLDFFVKLLDNRIRIIVGIDAFLCADSALTYAAKMKERGGDAAKGQQAIVDTGDKIATRLEKETELNSDAEAELQAALCDSLASLGNRASQERAVRHMSKLIKKAKDNLGIVSLMKKITNVWSDPAFLDGLKYPPAKPGRRDLLSPEKAAAWLDQLADAVHLEVPDKDKGGDSGDNDSGEKDK
jgi:hypothetical protein